MWSWSLEESFESEAKPEDIWKLWSDVRTWPIWDKGLSWCKLEGGHFIPGAKGEIKPHGAPTAKFRLTKVHKNHSFSDVTHMLLTDIEFSHELEPLFEGGVRITHRVNCKGLLAPLFWLTLRRSLKKDLPKTLETLSNMAEHKVT